MRVWNMMDDRNDMNSLESSQIKLIDACMTVSSLTLPVPGQGNMFEGKGPDQMSQTRETCHDMVLSHDRKVSSYVTYQAKFGYLPIGTTVQSPSVQELGTLVNCQYPCQGLDC